MSNVVAFTGQNVRETVDPDAVLEGQKGNLTEIVVCGFNKDGRFVLASSSGHLPDILWLLEWGRKVVLRNGEVSLPHEN